MSTISHGRRRSGRGERGNALIITVLVCLAMTGLAIVAVTSVNVQSQLANNAKMLAQAHYVAETGMMVTMERIQSMGAASLLKERERLLLEDPGKKITFPLASFGEGAVFTVKNADPQKNTLGHDTADIDFTVEVESMRSAPPPPGYQLNGDQQPLSLEVGLVASGRVGRLDTPQVQNGQSWDVGFSVRQVWALVPVP